MKQFIRLVDGQWPFTEKDLDPLCVVPSLDFKPNETEYVEPRKETKPVIDTITQKVVEIKPKLIDSVWTQQWAIVALSAGDISLNTSNLKSTLITAIDTHIAAIYQRFQRFDAEYTMREAAARAFKAAAYVGDAGIWVTGFATYTGRTSTAAADLIIAQADGLKAALVNLADQRMKKNLVASATTAADAQAVHDGIISTVNTIAASLT